MSPIHIKISNNAQKQERKFSVHYSVLSTLQLAICTYIQQKIDLHFHIFSSQSEYTAQMQTISSPYYGYLCFFFSHVSFTNTADCGIHIRTYEGEIHSSGHRTVSWTFIQIAIVYLQLTMCYTITSLHAIRLSFYVA